MKKLQFPLFILMNIINYVPVLLGVLLYKEGAPVIQPLFIALLPTLVVLNYVVSEKVWQIALLSGHLLLSTFLGNALNIQLHYLNVSRVSETIQNGGSGLILGMVYTAVLSAIAVAAKYFVIKNRKKRTALRK